MARVARPTKDAEQEIRALRIELSEAHDAATVDRREQELKIGRLKALLVSFSEAFHHAASCEYTSDGACSCGLDGMIARVQKELNS